MAAIEKLPFKLPNFMQATINCKAKVREKVAAVVLSVGLSILLCLLFFPPHQQPQQQSAPDSISYYAIADGHSESAYYYYAGRILNPITAKLVAHVFGLNVSDGFRLVSCASMFVLLASVAFWDGMVTVVPFLLVPIVTHAFRSYFLPDIFYAGLIGLFFLLFRLNKWLIVPALLLLHLTRESTAVLTAVTVIVLFKKERLLACVVGCAGLVGIKITSTLVSHAIPNHHGMSTAMFDLLKVGYNIAANILGVVAWTDTNSATTGCDPRWVTNVHWGAIKQFGFCEYQWQRPIVTIVAILSAYGVMPLLIRRIPDRSQRQDLRIAFWYGLASLVLVPLIGGTVERYTLYAWPLFWLYSAEALTSIPRRRKIAVMTASLAAAWTPTIVDPVGSLAIVLLLYGIAGLLLIDILPPFEFSLAHVKLAKVAHRLRNKPANYA